MKNKTRKPELVRPGEKKDDVIEDTLFLIETKLQSQILSALRCIYKDIETREDVYYKDFWPHIEPLIKQIERHAEHRVETTGDL